MNRLGLELADTTEGAFTAYYSKTEPLYLIIAQSGSRGYYHVIEDCPGPDYRHFYLTKEQIEKKYDIIFGL